MRIIGQKGDYGFVFDRRPEPVATVIPGEEVTLLTEDAYSGLLRSEDDDLDEINRKRKIHIF